MGKLFINKNNKQIMIAISKKGIDPKLRKKLQLTEGNPTYVKMSGLKLDKKRR